MKSYNVINYELFIPSMAPSKIKFFLFWVTITNLSIRNRHWSKCSIQISFYSWEGNWIQSFYFMWSNWSWNNWVEGLIKLKNMTSHWVTHQLRQKHRQYRARCYQTILNKLNYNKRHHCKIVTEERINWLKKFQ